MLPSMFGAWAYLSAYCCIWLKEDKMNHLTLFRGERGSWSYADLSSGALQEDRCLTCRGLNAVAPSLPSQVSLSLIIFCYCRVLSPSVVSCTCSSFFNVTLNTAWLLLDVSVSNSWHHLVPLSCTSALPCRSYRAPEVILGLRYGVKVDVVSIFLLVT